MSTTEIPGHATTDPSVVHVDMTLETVVIPVSDVDAREGVLRRTSDGGSTPTSEPATSGSSSSTLRVRGARSSSAPGSRRPHRGRPSTCSSSPTSRPRTTISPRTVSTPRSSTTRPAGTTASPRASGRRVPTPNDGRTRRSSEFRDPDGNVWQLQEITSRLPGRVDATARRSPPPTSSRGHSSVRRPRTASTRSARVSGTRTGPPGTPRSCWRSRPAPSRRSERLRRHRPRRRRARRALRRRARRRRAPRRGGRTRARGWRVLVLGVHPVQDAAPPGRGRARGERGRGDRRRSTSRPRSPGATTWCRSTPTRAPRSGSPTTAST